MREKMDTRKANGGVVLGLNGLVIKSHGGADAEGLASAIELARDMARNDLVRMIAQDRAVVGRAGEPPADAVQAATG
jgi:glycerol-3-phosphate acyltransferase PlsX